MKLNKIISIKFTIAEKVCDMCDAKTLLKLTRINRFGRFFTQMERILEQLVISKNLLKALVKQLTLQRESIVKIMS